MGRSVISLFLFLIVGSAFLVADDFWTTKEIAEIDGYSELDGVVKIMFKDAVTAKPVSGIQVVFDDGTMLVGNPDGVVKIPSDLVENAEDKKIPYTASAPGYISYRDSLEIQLGSVINKRFVMSPDLPLDQARFVLEWQKKPADLDAWLTGPDFTVSYRNMKNAQGNARLDRDAQQGYGPETLTLLHIRQDADYLFSVDNYSNEAPMAGVKVSLYLNNTLVRIISLPKTNAKKTDVLRIHGGQIEYLVR